MSMYKPKALSGHRFRKPDLGEKGFTLIEIISAMVIISVLAAIWIPRYIDAESSAKMRGWYLGVAELNGRETLSWAVVKISNTGYRPTEGDKDVWKRVSAGDGLKLGAEYELSIVPAGDLPPKQGTLTFKKDTSAPIDRTASTIETPGKWQKM